MERILRIPAYIRAAFLFIGIYLFVYTLYIGQDILIPIACAFILSILLSPLVSFLVRRKVNRIVAIGFAVVVAVLLALGLIYFVASQLSLFNNALPMMREKFKLFQGEATQWIASHFNVSIQKCNAWFDKTKAEIMSNGNAIMAKTILGISSVLILVFLIPVYVAMILYYEPLLLVFGKKIFSKVHHQKLEEVLVETKTIVQSYLNGLLIESVIVSALNAFALLMLGIDYAILLGIIGGLLNMIPFIGGIVAVALPMAIAIFTKSSAYYALMVLGAYLTIQFIDNHYITPKIVASKVRINALVAVIVVLIGNALWGIPGMFLALPVTGILKVIFEHVEVLKPWAYLLGDTMPVPREKHFQFFKKKKTAGSKHAQIIFLMATAQMTFTFGDYFKKRFSDTGIFTRFSVRFFKYVFRAPFEWSEILLQCFKTGYQSLPLVGITAFIMGLVMTMQTRPSLVTFGAESLLPGIVSFSVVKEIGPIITALVCAGKISSRMGAELGSMRVTEQIDAMEVSGINPYKFLVIPRVLATTLMVPILTIFSDAIAMAASFIAANVHGDITLGSFFRLAMSRFDFIDIIPSIIKSIFFGFAIGMIGCYKGYTTTDGTTGVGRAANSAVVAASLTIFVLDLIMVQITDLL